MAKRRPRDKRRPRQKNSPEVVRGIISITRRGTGYLSHPDFEEDVEIDAGNLYTALNGDAVEVQLSKSRKGKRPSGHVQKILERARTQFVGTLEKKNGNLFLVPDEKKFYRDIHIVKPPLQKGYEEDTKALVHLEPWTDSKKDPEGKVLEVIGKKGLHETEMRAIVLSHGFETEFTSALEQEAKEIQEKAHISKAEEKERRDFRDTATFTIDPEDAKDFDDALSIKRLPHDLIEVGIHIADVSHYVRPGSALDLTARERGTSIYLVDRTIPMLPEILSNDVCSLKPKEDKLTYSAVFVLDQRGKVKQHWFGKTIINSDKRFTYKEAQEVLDQKQGPFFEELTALHSIAKSLRDERFKHGAIDFDQDEVAFKLDSKGKPLEIIKKERLDTNRFIEEFMLLGNREVATHFQKLARKNPQSRATFIYRVHDVPSPEKIEELDIFLRAIGYQFKTRKGEVTAKELNRLFREIEGKPEENLIKTATIRSMAKAVYSTKNIGHFGLSFTYYTHFTSPIRRYPDIMVHRIMKKHLSNEPLSQKELLQYESLALQSSRREVEAVEAERDSIKFKQVEYMKEHVGERFEGIITGVVDWGFYVEERETKAEGLVRIASLENDFYEFDRPRFRLVGTRSKKTYILGDKVSIRLVGANLEEKLLEWELVKGGG